MLSILLSIQCHVFWVSWRMSFKYSQCVPYCDRLPAVSAGMVMLRVQKRWHNVHWWHRALYHCFCTPQGQWRWRAWGWWCACTTLWHVIVSSYLEGRPGGRRGGGRVKGHDVLKVWQSAYRTWIQASKGWDVNHWWGWAGTRAMDSEMEGVRVMVCMGGLRGGRRIKGHDVFKVWQSAYCTWIHALKRQDVDHWQAAMPWYGLRPNMVTCKEGRWIIWVGSFWNWCISTACWCMIDAW